MPYFLVIGDFGVLKFKKPIKPSNRLGMMADLAIIVRSGYKSQF